MSETTHPPITLGTTFAAVLVSLALAGCAGSRSTEPLDEADEPAPAAAPLATPAERPPAFDSQGNPYVPGTDDLLARTFYFDYDQSSLDSAALSSLSAHAKALREHPNKRVTIEGHADERGSRDYNLALGERRALAVRLYLVSAGVKSNQIDTVSYGEERPDDVGHDDSAWSRNRRAYMNYRNADASVAYAPAVSR